MRIRRVLITDVCNIENPASLGDETLVKKVLFGPSGVVLFEVYDPIFEATYDSDQRARMKARSDAMEAITRREWEIYDKERSILSPLFADGSKQFHGVEMGIPTYAALYQFMGKHRRKWPSLVIPPRWEQAVLIQLTISLMISDLELRDELQTETLKWLNWVKDSQGMMNSKLVECDNLSSVTFQLHFATSCGDWMAVLLAMLIRCASLPLDSIRIEPLNSKEIVSHRRLS